MTNKRECEVCGKEVNYLTRRKIEGVIMEVCSDCKDLGESPESKRSQSSTHLKQNNVTRFQNLYPTPSVSLKPQQKYPPSKSISHEPYSREEEFSHLKIVDKAHEILLKCRIQTGLSPKDFAASVLIKENYYKRVERGTTALPINIARKFEIKYHIKLVEVEAYEEEDDLSKYNKKNQPQTDSVIYFRKRGQKPEYDQ